MNLTDLAMFGIVVVIIGYAVVSLWDYYKKLQKKREGKEDGKDRKLQTKE